MTQSIQDVSNQLLQILNEEKTIDGMEALQAATEQFAQENEQVAKQKEEAKPINQIKNKAKNKPVFYQAYGIELPFTLHELNMESLDNIISSKNFPWGITCQANAVVKFWSFKGNINLDFVPYLEETHKFSLTGFISLGMAPIHNDFLFLGLYGTAGLEFLGDFIIPSVGGTGTCVINLSKNFGIFVNLDATYRYGQSFTGNEYEEVPAFSIKNTWRVSPSVGLAFRI